MATVQELPIDRLLPEVVATLRERRALVLEAPPGAGKTTRVPRALLEAGIEGEIVVLEPRRLAARLAARRVADELGERVGGVVGYRVRHEDVGSARTRIRFVTEGTLTRWVLASPRLEGVGAVLLDEFHERHLQTDVALAMLTALRRGARPDLRLAVMSATLDGDRVAAHLGCPMLRSEGRRFDVKVTHHERPDDRPLGLQVASAVRQLVDEGLDGHVLVFLPGAREIRRALEACEAVASRADLALVPLHGDLSPDEQDAALAPSPRRKVILATNVAESSVTIDGVAAVVDSGLARQLTHSPWTGMAQLRTAKISRASAAQRAGRAGRTRAGSCVRLYTRHDHDQRPEHDVPELLRADLAEPSLELRAQGVDPTTFTWLDAPPPAALDAARELLARLGAIDDAGGVTPLGRAMLRLPLHPRLARLVLEADRLGMGREGCAVAALLSERDVRASERASFDGGRPAAGGRGPRSGGASSEATSSDVLARLEQLERASDDRLTPGQLRAIGLDPGAVQAVARARRQLEGRLPRGSSAPPADREGALLRAVLAGFADRVARRRKAGGRDLVLSGGGSARQGEGSHVHDAAFVVVVATAEGEEVRGGAQGARGGPQATLLSAVEPEWLLEAYPERVRDEREVLWNPEAERVEVVERLMYDRLALDESRGAGGAGAETEAAAALAKAALERGLAAFVDPPDAVERFLARARFLASVEPTFPRFDDDDVRARLVALCRGRRGFDELKRADLLGELTGSLRGDEARLLAEQAPERVELMSGRRAPVVYEPGKPPHVESRLQDFFGMREGPRVGFGRVALTLHLLAPSGRPVQITGDLQGFWQRHYPQIRKELCRKYPRHNWPDDPTVPQPTMARDRDKHGATGGAATGSTRR